VELVPVIMYSATLPYLGAASAAEELRIPPPPQLATRARTSPGSGSRG
jgi:hypothetical protein